MARMHGSQCRVYLGARDASDDLMSIDVKAEVETHESTTFAADGSKRFDAGLRGWSGELEAFYQPQSGGIGRQLEAVGDGTAGLGVLSIYDGDADAIGDTGVLGGEALFTSRGQPIKVNDLIKLSGSLQGVGRLGLVGKLLHVLDAETGDFTGDSLDNGASSAGGGRLNLHVTAATGEWTVSLEGSADDSDWSELAAVEEITAVGAHTVEVSGTVPRYLRIVGTEDSAGSLTFVGGFARY